MKQSFFKLHNIVLMLIAITTIVVGFVFLGKAPVNGTQTLTIAPILLTLGYIVLVPLAILFKGKTQGQQEGD